MGKRPHHICTTSGAAGILGLSTTMVQTLVDRGELHGWKTEGGHRRIALQSVLDYQSQRSVPAKPALSVRRRPKITALVLREAERLRWQARQGATAGSEQPVKIVQALDLLASAVAAEPPHVLVFEWPGDAPEAQRSLAELTALIAQRRMQVYVLAPQPEPLLTDWVVQHRHVHLVERTLTADWLEGLLCGMRLH
ncbi:MAG: hypothetical protein RL559_1470 [Pseudomonadota bacterium]|jgi:excisionase family DNA binding protein